jgi:hypothetical protein
MRPMLQFASIQRILFIERIHVEINPYLNQLKDLSERGQTLRGYL